MKKFNIRVNEDWLFRWPLTSQPVTRLVRLQKSEDRIIQVPWYGDRCILCAQPDQLTEEHIIPESLGGKLFSTFLCKTCNDNFGQEVENVAKEDPSIRVAAEHLKEKIPHLARSLSEGQKYIASSKVGKVSGVVKKGRFHVLAKKGDDGSLIQTTKDARKNIKNIILKMTKNNDVLRHALEKFDSAPDEKRIELLEGLEVVKWRLSDLEPSLEGKLLDVLVPLKIAFEYVACHVGTLIYSESEQLMEVKKALLGRDRFGKCYEVEYLRAKDYAPFHGLVLEENGPPAVVQIRLFGSLAYRVRFRHIAVQGPRYVYSHYLAKDQEVIREVAIEGKTYSNHSIQQTR